MILISNPDKSQWQEILKRPVMNTENLFDTVRSVIDRVKEEGDPAVLDYEEKFDKVVLYFAGSVGRGTAGSGKPGE